MGIKSVEDQLLAKITAALTVAGQSKVKTVDVLPSDWDKDMLRKFAAVAPAVLIAFSGGQVKDLGANDAVSLDAQWSVIAVTAHASGNAARRRGDSQQIGAFEICERLVPELHGFTVPDEGSLNLVAIENLWSGEIEKQGLAVYAMRFGLLMSFPLVADESGMGIFLTFDGKYDLPPRELYLSLPGGAGNYASTPDSQAISIAGDLDIRVRVALDDWTPAAEQMLAAKFGVANQGSYRLSVLPGGQLRFGYSTTGANAFNRDSTAACGFQDGTAHWVRCTADVDNGAAGHDVKFYKSDDYDPATGAGAWTQIGATVVTAGVIAIFDGNAALALGADSAGASSAAGKLLRARLLNGINGVLAAEFRADDATPNTVAFASKATGEIWTRQGAAVIADDFAAEDTVSLPQ